MSSVRSLFQSAAIYTTTNVLNAAIPFLLLPILTRVLLPADYGVIAMFNATVGILGAFTGLSVHGAVNVRFVDHEGIDFPRYVGSCLYVLLFSTSLTFGGVALFLWPLSKFTAIPPLWLLLAVLVSGCNFLIQVRLGIWLMAKRPVYYGVFQTSLSLLNMGLSLLFVLYMHMGYEGRLVGVALAVSLYALIGFLTLTGGGWVSFRPKSGYMKEALSFGMPLVPHVVGGFLIAAADRFIINDRLGLDAAGIYLVAVQLGTGMGLLADAINKAFVPWLYEQLKENAPLARFRIVKGTWVYFFVALILASFVALFSYWIVSFVAGPSYIAAAKALAWIGFGQAFAGMYLMVTNYIFYMRQTKILPWVTMLAGGTGVLLAWYLTPVLGISGAALAFAVAMCIRFLMTWWLAQKVCPMPWFSFSGAKLIQD